MATLTTFSFSKRHRSTKQPSSAGTPRTITLKDGTDLISPVFLLNNSGVPSFNYCQFEGRYYFVNDIKSVRQDLWEVSCTEDYLATHKTLIGTTTANILYATGGRNDIIDTRIPQEATIYVSKEDKALSALTNFSINQTTIGSVVLSCTGIGSFGSYLLNDLNQQKDLIRNLAAFWSSLGIGSVQDALAQFYFGGSAAECLKGCIGLPFDFVIDNTHFGGTEQLFLGNYPCTDRNGNHILVREILNPLYKGSINVTIPWRYSDWRRRSPYSQVKLYVPLIGIMDLPTDELVNYTSIDITYAINVTSGDVSVEIAVGDSPYIIATASSNVSISIPYGSANIDYAKLASAAVSGIASAAAFVAMPSTATGSGFLNSAINIGKAAGGETTGGGGLSGGSVHGLWKDIICMVYSKDITDSQSNLDPIIGKPVMQKATIGSYSGFVQTDGCQVAGAILDSERDAINTLCDGGIYYE